jgi:hypothetical protein
MEKCKSSSYRLDRERKRAMIIEVKDNERLLG